MKKSNPNQKTLFQSWSKQSSSHGTSSRQDAQNNTRFDPLEIIELGDDDEDDGLLAAAMEMATVDENTLPQTSTTSHNNNANTSISSDSPKEIEHIPGFDMEAGNVWIYPTNYPIRNYQFQIVEKALMMNTLVTLPTGLGKTFIAAVLMYNYYRWYPQGKIIFMAPTKPLVAQQIEACYNIMGIPESDTTEMTGAMAPTRREGLWKSKRVFFLTAQVLMNDLGRGSCAAEDVVLLVFDEAHKALGNHSYCQVIREIHSYTRHFRVLALSATPGDDIKAVQQVMSNLLISHMELRSEDSPDIQAYTHKRTVDKIVVPVGEDIARIKTQFLKVLGGIVGRLFCNRALWQNDPQRVTKFMLLTGRTKFREREAEGYTNGQKGAIEGDFAMAISLYHAYELLHQHGILSFYNFIKAIVDGSKGMSRARSELMRHTDFMNVMNELRELIEKPPDEMSAETSALFSQFTSPRRRSMMREAFDPSFKSHPKLLKLEEVIVEHFQNFSVKNNAASASTSESDNEVNTRVMIFSQYRDSVGEITAILNKHKPLVRVMSFIGQASTGKSSRGLSQKEQLEVVQRFRKGGYNTLVATCVGEEGLDIGDVDLIVCFDAHASPIRLVQRMGRTGRKRNGRIVVLVTEGKEEQVYKRSLSSKKSIHKAIVQGSRSFVLYDDNPRMIPRHLTPRVHKMEMTVGKYVGNSKKKRKSETDSTNGNIKNLLSKSTSSKSSTAVRKDDGFLTYEELEYWQKNFKLPNCEAGTTPSKRRRSRNSLPGPGVKELSLNEWMPWQNVPSPVDKIAHSRRTEHLIEILEFIELHNGEDDSYDVEMMSFLNENDLPNVDGGLEDDINDAPLIILNDGDDVIRLGKEKEKNENQKKKRKVSNDSNAAESKKRKTSIDKTKETSIKEKKKSKASKKPSPTRKWKDYLKAFENEDNDFEAVEKECTVGDNDSFETSNALLDGATKEQPGGNFVVESEGENECGNPVKNVTEETDDNDDDTILSSQQVSQLLPSVNPSDPFLFRSKILDGKNCAREVPIPPSLDTLNEISPSVSSLTSKSHQNEKQKWDKLSSCRRNYHKDGKRDTCEFSLMDSDFERGNGKMEVEGMKIEESPTKTAIIEEPPDVFDFDDTEFCDESIPGRSPKRIFKEPPDVFEFDDTEFRNETITDKNPKGIFKEPPDVFQFDDHVEGLGQDEHNVHKVTTDEEPEKEKHKKEQQKENNENDDDFEEPFGLFEIDLTNDMMDDNKNENVELDNKTASDFPTIDKNRNKIRDAPDPIHLEDIGDDLSKPFRNSLLSSNSSSKSSHDSVEFDFGEDSLSECLLVDLVQDGKSGDKSCFSSNLPRKDVEEPTKEETKENCQSDSKEMLRNSKETSPKASKRRLESSISKLGAFERSTKTSDSSGLSNRVNDSIENNSKTVAESTRMTPTSEKRQNDDFEFKKPSISVLNRFPKSPGLRGFNEHTLEKHGLPQSKLTGVSTKLSLKKTAGNRLERGREGSVGKLASMNQNESEQVQSKVTFNKFDNIQMKIPKEKNLCTSLVNSRSQVQSKTKCQQQSPSLEQTGVCDEQTLKSPTCKNIGCTQSADEDSPVIRNRSKSTLRPTISSPVSPACHTPVGVKIITEADEESPLVRKRSKIKKKNGDVVAIAESDEEDEDEGAPTETRCVPERQITRKQRKDDMRKAKMILSDSEEEFILENIKKGSKDKHDLNPRDRKMHLKASVKRKRQHSVVPSKKQRTHRIDDFLDEEAELSGTDIEEFSDDESDGDGEFDSFIDDSSQLTQNTPVQANPKKRKSNHDMLAVYRQSLFSPLARDLNFKSPTMCRNKNRYKMKYGVENCDESLSEAEETYSRESDLENELGPDSDLDVSDDTLSVEDDESDYDANDDNGGEKDSTPVASQIRRPFNRVKRKRIILNESIEESPVRLANTNHQSPIVTPSKACVTKPQYACPSKKSPFVTSSSIVNREPPTRESTPLNIRSNNTKSLSKDPNLSVDSNETMTNNNLSTTFEFDWGLDFSDSDLLDAVEDDKKVIDQGNNVVAPDQDNINRKSDVCDQEMQEIAFAMAATDDDVNVEMSELPTFSLGLDLFGGDSEDIGTDVQENTSAKQRKDLNSVEESKKAQFTKISPRSSAVSNGRGNSNQNGKNMELPSAQHLKNSHFSTAQKMKNVGPSTTNSKLSTRQTVNNIGRYPSNGTLSADQNIHHVEPSSLPRNKAISSLCLGQNVKKNDAQNTNESTFSKPQNIMNTGAFKWSNSDTSTVANSGTTSKNQQQSRQCRTEKNSTSLVQPNTQANNKWSWGSNSSGRLSHLPSNGFKDVTNIDVKPGGSSNGVKSVPTAFVSPSQKDKGKLVVLADTKEISNSQVVSTLRRQHNIKVEVCQLQHCDYVVSNRMGVIRKLSSAVANGSNSTKILDRMRVVCDLYDRPCFIIEKDRVKSGETDRDYSKSNAYIYTLACMAQTHIKVLTSQSQEETASLLTDLATLEAKKNTHIVAPTVMNKETQQVFRFLLSIPRVSYVTALNLCSSLRTMRDLLSCSPEDLKKTTRQLSESRASELHSYLRHEFNESMINKNMRKNT